MGYHQCEILNREETFEYCSWKIPIETMGTLTLEVGAYSCFVLFCCVFFPHSNRPMLGLGPFTRRIQLNTHNLLGLKLAKYDEFSTK